MCKIGDVKLFVEKHHPDTMLANRAVQIFNDNALQANIVMQTKTINIGQVLGQKG